jgi:hypothetical protein
VPQDNDNGIPAKIIAAKGYRDLVVEPLGDRGEFVATAFVTIGGQRFRAQAIGRTESVAVKSLAKTVSRD